MRTFLSFTSVSKKLLINSLEAIPTGATVLRQAQHERENHLDFGPSSVHPELVEGWLASFSTASKGLGWAGRSGYHRCMSGVDG